ncbi:glycohydrolase toxin TNT-related protein [Mycobacterium sp. 1245805.9]|uniref:glycohydrolase toxin TNT-related protein n=1 Tax=Mycobacterium sp. 1245805.9 TaxID=1856862 RepID=UPI000800ADEB|nr:glycohydrolase toxin TNT-related protein [Mycobacterium sp. 1245805.9]OBI92111.1 hypothetical protein A9X00_15655 [Mycobacterium sp. 1245805.9]
MVPLVVDPQALFAVGSAVAAAGDGLAANLTVLTAGFAANTGHDAAGEVFGLGYQDAAEKLLQAAAAAVNACRQSGAKIQQGAANYSNAEAASNIRGGDSVLQAPPEPANISPPGPPGTLGPGQPPPLLWAVVQSFVDDVWPDGDVAGMHAAAARWRGFSAATAGMRDSLNAAMVLMDAHQIPEGGKIDVALSQIRDCIVKISDASGELAAGLDNFANKVGKAQNAIRDLLNRLGSLTDLGHDLMLIVKGDALEEIKKIARDVNDVLHHLGQEARASEQAIRLGLGVVDGLVVKLEHYVRGELKQYLGDAVGNQVATVFDVFANANEGVLKGAVGMALSIGDLDPRWFALDPKGAADTWAGLGKGMWKGSVINGLANPQEFVESNWQQLKGLLHLDDWSTARPGLGLGENIFDVGTLLIPGGGEAAAAVDGAGAAARGAEAAAQAERAAGRAADGFAGVVGPRGALADIAGKGSSLTKDLEGVTGKLPTIEPPVGGKPVPLPPKPLDAPVAPAPRAPEAAPGAPHEPGAAPGPDEAGGPHEPAGGAPAPAHASPGGPHDPAGGPPHEPGPVPASGPHEPGSVPGGGPHGPLSVPGGDPHQPAPASVAAPHEPLPATAPGSALPTVPAGIGDRLLSATPTPGELVPRIPVTPGGAPAELAPAAAHAVQPAPALSTATPHSMPPAGRPTELPTPGDGAGHGTGDGGSAGGPPDGKPPHGSGPHEPGGRGTSDGGGPHGPGDSGPSGGRGDGPPEDGDGSRGHENGGSPGDGRPDPVHSHAPSGDGWHRLPDGALDPHYGEPLPEHWDFTDNPVDPSHIKQSVANLITDPEAPFGRDPQGHAYTEQQYAERFNSLSKDGDHWMNFPGNGGAVPGTKVAFTDPDQFTKIYGNQVDRVGMESGKYLAVMEDGLPASWEARALHVNNLADPYNSYVLKSLPDGWQIEVSEVAPGVGQPGGSLQVRILNSEGRAMTVEELTDPEIGVLE